MLPDDLDCPGKLVARWTLWAIDWSSTTAYKTPNAEIEVEIPLHEHKPRPKPSN